MPDQPPQNPPTREDPVRVFVSYAREDRKWLDPQNAFNLIPFLEDSLRRHNVSFWYDHALQPGDEFKRFIETEIDKAQIALLLVSQSFLNSEFIEEREMPRIHERARDGEMLIVPVLVGPCKWGDYPLLADRQMVPNGNPLIKYTQNEAQWEDVKFDILEGLREQVKRIRDTAAHKQTEEALTNARRKSEQEAEVSQRAAAERRSQEAAAEAARKEAEARRRREMDERSQRETTERAARAEAASQASAAAATTKPAIDLGQTSYLATGTPWWKRPILLWSGVALAIVLTALVVFLPRGVKDTSSRPDHAATVEPTSLGVRTLQGHTDHVTSVAFSPDGRTVASGSGDHTIKLWDVATGQNIRTLQGHTDWVNSVAFGLNGGILASGSSDNTIKLWGASGEIIRTLRGNTYRVYSVAFSPDGWTLASGSENNTIKLWNAPTGKNLHTLQGSSVAFSPDGRTLVSSEEANIKLWDAATGKSLRTFPGHTDGISSVVFSPNGNILASCGTDVGNNSAIKLWDAATGKNLSILGSTIRYSGYFKSIAFGPDGHTLASGDNDGTIKLWDTITGQNLRTLPGHTNGVSSVVFSPDGHILVSGGNDNTVKLWDVTNIH